MKGLNYPPKMKRNAIRNEQKKVVEVVDGHNLLRIATVASNGLPCVRSVDYAAGLIRLFQLPIILQQIHQIFRIAGFVFLQQFSVQFRIEGFFILHHIKNQAG
jgi:hypothetical protein